MFEKLKGLATFTKILSERPKTVKTNTITPNQI